MIVLLGIKGVCPETESEPHITQLAALRVKDDWEIADRFFQKIDSMKSERSCFDSFLAWLQPEDVLLVWKHREKAAMKKTLRRLRPKELNPDTHQLFYRIEGLLNALPEWNLNVDWALGMWETCVFCGAEDSAEAQRQLCLRLHLKAEKLTAGERTVGQDMSRRLKNAMQLERVDWSYVYSPDSSVFHRKDCGLILNARSILGVGYYKNAAKGRRPCRVCKPNRDVEYSVSKEFMQQLGEIEHVAEGNVLRRIRVVGGGCVKIRPKEIAGFCHFSVHPGALTKQLLKQRACLQKRCRHFRKKAVDAR